MQPTPGHQTTCCVEALYSGIAPHSTQWSTELNHVSHRKNQQIVPQRRLFSVKSLTKQPKTSQQQNLFDTHASGTVIEPIESCARWGTTPLGGECCCCFGDRPTPESRWSVDVFSVFGRFVFERKKTAPLNGFCDDINQSNQLAFGNDRRARFGVARAVALSTWGGWKHSYMMG